MEQGKPICKNSRLHNLQLICKPDKLLRLRARLEQANIDDDMKHPIILGDHPVVRLFIMSAHHQAMHMRPEVVRANLRRHFHILNGSRIIRSVLSRCIYCRRLKAKAYNPTVPALPWERVDDHALPFEYTLIDLFGFIFVCGVSRAIHLEAIKFERDFAILRTARSAAEDTIG